MNSHNQLQSRFDLIVFDLDGTLVDSRLDLANSVNHTRVQLGLSPISTALICSYVGDGAPVLLRRALGPEFSDVEIAAAVKIFLEHYREHLLDHTLLYPGVKETLERLRSRTLAVLTNKPANASNAILKGLGVLEKFAYVFGGDSFEQKKPDPVGVLRLLQQTGIAPNRSLMVGDSRNDIMTGRTAGIPTCGVTYGLAPEQLADPKPEFLINDLRDLVPIVFPPV